MNTTQIALKGNIRAYIFDALAVAFIFLVPTISHMISLPLYLIEPMRLMVILALVHTNKRNAYVLALLLPLFSFAVSAHPVFPKMVLIAAELMLNVWLFNLISKTLINRVFPAMLLSIVLSKAFYYLVKFTLLSTLLQGDLVATPLYIQGITTVAFSIYAWLLLKKAD
ncbi:MAG: hypothetical protein JW783_13560 [Bacteroidales bacterium]|nr:hypothetical protein [Bacteroidales bacterium]